MLAIPVLLFIFLLTNALYSVLWLLWIVVLLRGRIPHWLFDFIVALSRGLARANAYINLLTDVYPPFEGDHPVHLEISYPERISRWRLIFWKLITSVPHLFVVQLLNSVALALLPVAWIAIIFSGRFPKGLFDFIVGVRRWQQRLLAYLFSLTDAFPPYSLSAEAVAARGRAVVFSAVAGVVLVAAAVGGITAIAIVAARNSEQEVSVSYQRLVDGTMLPGETGVIGNDIAVSLDRVRDPADDLLPFLEAGEGKRFVGFEMTVRDLKARSLWFYDGNFSLQDDHGDHHRVFLALVNKRTLPEKISDGETASIELVFEIDADATPTELHYDTTGRLLRTLVYMFE